MYVLLHGAKRNVGDFLIFERSKELIRRYRNVSDFVEIQRWLPLEPYLDDLNRAEAIILCGGPCYGYNFYPSIIPFTADLGAIKSPIIPLGIGWGVGNTTSDIGDFRFTEESLHALQKIHSRIPYSSARDVVTEQVLKTAGITNVVTTGCPVWYSLPHVERSFEPPRDIRRIVVTTPAQSDYFKQTGQLLLLINRMFPKAEKYLVFHRGIWMGRYAYKREVLFNMGLAGLGILSRYRIVDAAYSTQKIEFYKDCDLHIGYRVHAHLDFLSLRKPSILLQEDARGYGQSQTLHTQDVSAMDNDALEQLRTILTKYLDTRFATFEPVMARMKEYYGLMTEFIQSF